MASGKGNESLLVMSSRECTAKQTGNGQLIYRAKVSMDVSDSAFGKQVGFLQEAEYIQIEFRPMPEQSQIITGTATGFFNGATLFKVSIPEQQTANGRIFVRGLSFNCEED